MVVTPLTTGKEVGFITFNPITRVVTWETSKALYIGNYTIEIFANLNGFTSNTSFQLEVSALPPVNNPPILSGLQDFFPTFVADDIKSGDLNFGPISDADAGDTVTLECTYIPDSGRNYFSIDEKSAQFRVTDNQVLISKV